MAGKRHLGNVRRLLGEAEAEAARHTASLAQHSVAAMDADNLMTAIRDLAAGDLVSAERSTRIEIAAKEDRDYD